MQRMLRNCARRFESKAIQIPKCLMAQVDWHWVARSRRSDSIRDAPLIREDRVGQAGFRVARKPVLPGSIENDGCDAVPRVRADVQSHP